jgi:hypothetical protein
MSDLPTHVSQQVKYNQAREDEPVVFYSVVSSPIEGSTSTASNRVIFGREVFGSTTSSSTYE